MANPYLPSWEYIPDNQEYLGIAYMYTDHMIVWIVKDFVITN